MDIKAVVLSLSLEEKASLCSGWDFWHTKSVKEKGVPSIMVSDGPHGLRKQNEAADHLGVNESIKAICFPTSVGLAASFDRDLALKMGKTLGREAAAEKLGVLLGPAINIKRSPLCGRNFEYMSEDPYLTGELSANYINGVQSNNVGVSLKHFAVNNQENRRMTISAEVDERALREIYLAAFETAVKQAQPWTIMCSYNKINGVFSSENPWLLDKVLRKEWGYEGFVMTDWGAINNRVEGVKAGLELEMPSSGGKNDRKIVEAVKDGSLNEEDLNTACERILNIVYRNTENKAEAEFDRDADHILARKYARECMVLLKNEGILPLSKNKKYAYIGQFAKIPRHQGGGSSHINSYKVTGCWEASEGIDKIFAEGYNAKCIYDQKLIDEAVAAAKACDVAVVFAGLPDSYESEGFDRKHMDMPESHNRLIEAVAEANPNTVVVLHNGSPVTMPWLNKVKGVLEAYLGGEAGGGAAYDILFGEVNPCAKLPETFPIKLEDTACNNFFPGNQLTVEYRESIYVGYRYYDTAKKDVLFPFGYGLSYTQFEYSDIVLDKISMKASDKLTVKFKIKNTGKMAGAEIAELYVSDSESTVFKAEKELKGFEKVYLEPQEEKEISITLDKRSFAFYNVAASDWQVESGEYKILVGNSSRDIKLTAAVSIKGDAKNLADKRGDLPDYYSASVKEMPAGEFSALLGRELSPAELPKGYKFTSSNTFLDTKDTKWGGIICKMIRKFVKDSSLGEAEIMISIMLNTPIRAQANMSGGMLTDNMVEGLLRVLNKDKTCKGFRMIIGGALHMGKNKKLAAQNKL